MSSSSRPTPASKSSLWWLALALCGVLAVGRSYSEWGSLSALRLPDNDDIMRLVQIRDWLAGQAFFDLTQYRLGSPGGVAMHWSRLGDVGPAAVILAMRPVLGVTGAELTALILWPSLLFIIFVLLGASIARRLGAHESAGVAVVLGALAWPSTALFVPGRIDHHGLQLVLLLVALQHLIGPASKRGGLIAGIAMAASLAVGIELVLSIAILCSHASAQWALSGDRSRLSGLALGLLGGLAAMAAIAPSNWTYPACDAFTRQAVLAATCGGIAMALLAYLPTSSSRRGRLLAAIGAAGAMFGVIALVAPACLGDPYSMIDPVLRRDWMGRVEEARGLITLGPAEWISIAGLPVAACIAAAIQTKRHGTADWALVVLLICGSLALAILQVRAIHVAAALAPAVLAPIVAQVRATGRKLTFLAWLLSTGISYALVGKAIASPTAPIGQGCDLRTATATLRQLPASTVLAPIDSGPWLLAQTRHRLLAAPYHRNMMGIRAWITGAQNPAQARAAGADILVLCPADRAGSATIIQLDGKE